MICEDDVDDDGGDGDDVEEEEWIRLPVIKIIERKWKSILIRLQFDI